jgi:hypothetical protein
MAGRLIFRHYGFTLRAMGGRGEKGTARRLVVRVCCQGLERQENPLLRTGLDSEEARPHGQANGPADPPRKASSQCSRNRTAHRHR